jgi:23S rRNA pseudouridine2605 synthase
MRTSPEPKGGESIRLQLWLARAGVASRRASEDIIRSGRVTVNGAVVTELGSRARLDDDVCLDGKRLALESEKRYLLLNKPSGYISAMSDPAGRPLAVELLKPYVAERVYNVGRLDEWSSGLLLFTNDGELAALLGHPSGGVDKEYEVATSVDIPDAFFAEFRAGLTIEGERYVALEAERKGPRGARIVLLEGKNREIRRVLEHFDLRAKSLRRTRIGPLRLGDLPEGRFRELSSREIEDLKHYHISR